MAVAFYDKLRFFKFFTTYDCFMGSLRNKLLSFGNCSDNAFAGNQCFCFAQNHCPSVHIRREDFPDTRAIPKNHWGDGIGRFLAIRLIFFVIYARHRNIFVIEHHCYLSCSQPQNRKVENTPHDFCCWQVDDKCALFVRVKLIAERCSRCSCDAFTPLDLICSPQFLSCIPAVHGIYQITDDHIHSQRCTFIIIAVIVIVDSNEPDTQQGENLLHVFAHTDIITAKTGKVFHDDGINLAIAHTIHHLLESRSVKIAACVAVIYKIHHRHILQAFFAGDIPLDQFFLVLNAVALILAIFAQVAISP